ncbi:hypothetical protein COCCADRAFT_42033 [Bipolaris zeicola 26-R-13]|uniref:Homing endonuclease LAGLIDADG domain-containing protein n=1 Tax=Cochliobolus carbonum (strain 26-R-13) TaxID=930089 RepID=W6XPF1_COCC2|nr:uncharacterized protein COCCADRAFT_42033 [Bipolaris zeicola 26-R-13]EUC27145.1 hypothetical protein COCCADRAFT_42033 [Bipolaris zeicola 26-R-13]
MLLAITFLVLEYFGGIGLVSQPNNNSTVEFRVHSIKDITNIIIPHFDNYPLLTKKYSDSMLFKNVINLMLEKQHTNLEGIQKIINTRASMNGGLSDQLKKAFPETIPVIRKNFFKCGYVVRYEKRSIAEFVVTRIDDIINHVIPFFEEYSIAGSKYSNYCTFKIAAFMGKNKEHLKEDGNDSLYGKNGLYEEMK